ncbi:MAG: hypothetical protein VXZ32_02640, partial [Verrucomicrobiota bacterium]|nr:hypothetical protein [Verrucomicrobiota bacterium]
MRKSHFLPSLNRSSVAQVFFSICLPILVLSSSFLRADLNNTVFIVAGGQYSDPFYNFTFESNGSVVNFQTYPLRKGNTYKFKGGTISASHPFKIGASWQTTSPHVVGGQLDQNSQTNNDELMVSIPSDFDGTLAYFCTIHSNMVKQFVIDEPLPPTNDFIPVYNLSSSDLTALTTNQDVSNSWNVTIEEVLNANNEPEIRFFPMFESNGEWVRLSDDQFYTANSTITSLQNVDAYLVAQNIYPVNAPNPVSGDGNQMAVFDFNSTHLYELTGSQSAPEGNYSIIEETNSGGSTYLTAKPMELINGEWLEKAQGIPYPLASTFGSMQNVEAYLLSQNLNPVN